jgi:hypothetical protein
MIQQAMPRGGVCAEVGVFDGGFADLILKHTQPMLLHLIDIWAQVQTCGWSCSSDEEGLENLATASRRFSSEIRSGRVILHQGTSSLVLATLAAGSLDWLNVDAGHSEEDVYADLVASHHVVKSDGRIMGHDIAMPGEESRVKFHYPGVRRAVKRFCDEYNWYIAGLTEVRPQPQRIDHTTPQTQSYLLEQWAGTVWDKPRQL